jgi:hypothetical protein
MIKKISELKQMPCVARMDNWGGNCGADECPAFHYFFDEYDFKSAYTPHHGKDGHSKPPHLKRGYCGFTGVY